MFYQRRCSTRGDVLPEEICYPRRYATRGDMLPEETCYPRRHATQGDMLPEETCYLRGHATRGDMLPKETCLPRRHAARGDMLPDWFGTPLPRYYQRCCDKAGHFDPYFNAGDFNAEILRLGVFLSRLPCMKNTLCITPEDICSRDSWMSRGDMLQHDLVHLTPRGLILLRNLTHRGITYLNSNTNPKPGSTGDCTIPESLNFAQWVVEFRENCGYDTLVASNLAKRTHPVAVAKSSKKK